MEECATLSQPVAKIDQHGRIVIPAHYRRALGLCEGDLIVFQLEDGALCIRSQAEAIRRAQDLAIRLAAGRSLVDELIAERRAEAAHE